MTGQVDTHLSVATGRQACGYDLNLDSLVARAACCVLVVCIGYGFASAHTQNMRSRKLVLQASFYPVGALQGQGLIVLFVTKVVGMANDSDRKNAIEALQGASQCVERLLAFFCQLHATFVIEQNLGIDQRKTASRGHRRQHQPEDQAQYSCQASVGRLLGVEKAEVHGR